MNYEKAKTLVQAARIKKLVENRCLSAFDSDGNQIISDLEICRLAVDIEGSVEAFVAAGEVFADSLEEDALAELR